MGGLRKAGGGQFAALPYNEVILEKYHDKKSDRNLYVFDVKAEETIEDRQAYIYMYQGSEVYEEKSGELADLIEAVLENKDKLRIIEPGEDGETTDYGFVGAYYDVAIEAVKKIVASGMFE